MNIPAINPINEFTTFRRNLPHWQLPGSIYFVTFRTYKNLELPESSKKIIQDTILFQDSKSCNIFAYVIMPDHIHIILRPIEISKNEYYNLSEIMKAIKGYSSKVIKKNFLKETEEAQTGRSVLSKHIFQAESFDRIIRNEKELFEKLNYIINNPIKKGLIEKGKDYIWLYINYNFLPII
jgi:putative transposase